MSSLRLLAITGCGPAGAEMLKLYRAEEWLCLAKVRLDSMVATAVRQSLIYFCDQAISVTNLFKAISVSLTNDNRDKKLERRHSESKEITQ